MGLGSTALLGTSRENVRNEGFFRKKIKNKINDIKVDLRQLLTPNKTEQTDRWTDRRIDRMTYLRVFFSLEYSYTSNSDFIGMGPGFLGTHQFLASGFLNPLIWKDRSRNY